MPELNEAIAEAYLALEEIDNFDLDSSDPDSVAKMDILEKEHKEAIAKVVSLAKDL